ncbi:hypothetical protein HK096_001182, partial [Nowakowskiella sp. JEL0078]
GFDTLKSTYHNITVDELIDICNKDTIEYEYELKKIEKVEDEMKEVEEEIKVEELEEVE